MDRLTANARLIWATVPLSKTVRRAKLASCTLNPSRLAKLRTSSTSAGSAP